MTSLSPAERIDALAARGIMLYLASSGELRAKCEPCFLPFLDAALPAIRLHKAALTAHFLNQRKGVERDAHAMPALATQPCPTPVCCWSTSAQTAA
jgi:hypothetical protein